MTTIAVKRVYEPHTRGDGRRVLVDRIWPRGISKETLSDAIWLRDIGPSNELRRWFGHKPERWAIFRKRYWLELDKNPEAVDALRGLLKKGKVTLLYSAHDIAHNQAIALRDYLQSR